MAKPPSGERTAAERIADALKHSAEKYPLGTLPLPVQEVEAIRVHIEWWASQQKELDDRTLSDHCDELVEAVVKQTRDEPVVRPDPIDGVAEGPVEGVLGEYLNEGKDYLFLAGATAIDHISRLFADGAEAILRSATDKTAKAEALRALSGSVRRGLYHDYPEEIRNFSRTSDQEAVEKAVDGLVAPVLARLLLKYEALLESQAVAGLPVHEASAAWALPDVGTQFTTAPPEITEQPSPKGVTPTGGEPLTIKPEHLDATTAAPGVAPDEPDRPSGQPLAVRPGDLARSATPPASAVGQAVAPEEPQGGPTTALRGPAEQTAPPQLERKEAIAAYKRECKAAGLKIADQDIARAACSTWNTRDPVVKWKAGKERPGDDERIRRVFRDKPHLKKATNQ